MVVIKMKIEDILNKLLDKRRYNRVNCIDISENEANILLDYITTLQRKEYNNSKAIEYIYHWSTQRKKFFDKIDRQLNGKPQFYGDIADLLNILEKGE